MDARELLKSGDLSAALAAATQDVKGAPGNINARIFLFELLAAAGQFERARTHLDVVAEKAPAMQEGILSYRAVLDAEIWRARVFAGDAVPQQVIPTASDPEPQVSALRLLRAGQHARAKEILDEVEEQRPPLAGACDGVAFSDIRNADDTLTAVLEVIAQGRYGWVPFRLMKRIAFDEPQFFRDLLWRPATIELPDGSSSKMFVPTRYPGSEREADDALRLGRGTDWREEGGVVQGIGQQAFLVGDDIRYVLGIRELTLLG